MDIYWFEPTAARKATLVPPLETFGHVTRKGVSRHIQIHHIILVVLGLLYYVSLRVAQEEKRQDYHTTKKLDHGY